MVHLGPSVNVRRLLAATCAGLVVTALSACAARPQLAQPGHSSSPSASLSRPRRKDVPPGGTLLVEPQAGYGVVDRFVRDAATVDVEMYELADQTFEEMLAADAARDASVRVLLDAAYHGREVNGRGVAWLRAHHVRVRWAADAAIFHAKTITVDDREALIATFDLVTRWNCRSVNFGVFDANPADVAAIVQAFDLDWAGAVPGPASNGSGDLVWSPGATDRLVSLIGSATTSLDVECEELSDERILDALLAAARRHVKVRVVVEADPSLSPALEELAAAGAEVVTGAPRAAVHACETASGGRFRALGRFGELLRRIPLRQS